MSFSSISTYVNDLITGIGDFCSNLVSVPGAELSNVLITLFLNVGVALAVFFCFAFPFIVIYHLVRFIVGLCYE